MSGWELAGKWKKVLTWDTSRLSTKRRIALVWLWGGGQAGTAVGTEVGRVLGGQQVLGKVLAVGCSTASGTQEPSFSYLHPEQCVSCPQR